MKRVLDLLMPPTCPGCRREGVVICVRCQADLARRLDEPAGVPIGLHGSQPAGLVQLEWCAPYSGPARDCVHALKYGGEQRLVEPLAELMAQRWQRASVGGDVLVPVPVHPARRRERGFDQAELLARAIGRLLGLPVVPAVQRATRTRAQHNLDRGARARNVGRAFTAVDAHAQSVVGRWVVIVDDIVTTGATLSGCAAVLWPLGVRAVSGLALARER